MRLNNQRLKGPQVDELRQAIRDAFANEQEFREFLYTQLDRQLDDITVKDTFPTEILNVIKIADTEDWTEELLRAARSWRPTNAKLWEFAAQFDLTTSPPETKNKSGLERLVIPDSKQFDMAIWREKMEQIEGQICRVEVKDGGDITYGTGFLLGPDVVITNYHIVKNMIGRYSTHENIICRFDFKKTLNASLPGLSYPAMTAWCLDHSEYSPFDQAENPWDYAHEEDQLDYALIRLSARVGEECIGGAANKNPNAHPRGWIKLPTITPEFHLDTALLIAQHQKGKQLTFAIDMYSIIQLNRNNTRVFYKTATDEGSSGAPCFNDSWQLVALHQGGDPNFAPQHQAEYNQGIPFSAIINLLTKRNKLHLLGTTSDPIPLATHSKASAQPPKPTHQESHTEQQETHEQSPYAQACQLLREASTSLQQAHAPFQKNQSHPPSIFKTSRRHLQSTQYSIQKLLDYLHNPPLLPSDIANETLNIIHLLRKMNNDIEQNLLPHLSQGKSGNFATIINLMSTVEKTFLTTHVVTTQHNPLKDMQLDKYGSS